MKGFEVSYGTRSFLRKLFWPWKEVAWSARFHKDLLALIVLVFLGTVYLLPKLPEHAHLSLITVLAIWLVGIWIRFAMPKVEVRLSVIVLLTVFAGVFLAATLFITPYLWAAIAVSLALSAIFYLD